MSEVDEEDADRARVAARWHALALIHGFNELGRLAENMGQRIGCRLGFNSAVARYRELGGEIEMKEAENRIAFLGPIELPTVNLYPRDIEMMRKAVVDFDAEHGGQLEDERIGAARALADSALEVGECHDLKARVVFVDGLLTVFGKERL